MPPRLASTMARLPTPHTLTLTLALALALTLALALALTLTLALALALALTPWPGGSRSVISSWPLSLVSPLYLRYISPISP